MGGVILVAVLVWALIWGGLSAAIWSAKGGSALSAFGAGFLLGIFATVYFAFATPKPAAVWTGSSVTYASAPIDWLPRWRDRRLGPVGWMAAGLAVVAIALMVIFAPTPPH
jgi:hypothetical protein